MKPRWLHDALIGGILILMQGAILAPFAEEANAEGSWPLIFSLCYSVVGVALLRHWPRQGWDLGRYLLVALIALAFISASWSPTPELVMRRSVALTGTMLFALYLATTMDWRRFVRVLFWSCAVIVVSCYLFAAFHPTWNDAQDGRGEFWRGAFIHRNVMGRFLVFNVIVCWAAVRAGLSPTLAIVSVLASFFLGYKSGSVTAFGVSLVVASAMIVFWPVTTVEATHRWRRMAVVGGLLLGITVALGYWNETLLGLLQRDTTLTGRTELWNLLWLEFRGQLMVGAGFSSFWSDVDGTVARISATVDWIPTHAHNGFIDLMLDLGVGGLAIFLAYLMLSWRAGTSHAVAPAFRLYLVFLVAYNLSESSLLRQNNIFLVVLLVLSEHIRLSQTLIADSASAPKVEA